jgi:hypothetical protein
VVLGETGDLRVGQLEPPGDLIGVLEEHLARARQA